MQYTHLLCAVVAWCRVRVGLREALVPARITDIVSASSVMGRRTRPELLRHPTGGNLPENCPGRRVGLNGLLGLNGILRDNLNRLFLLLELVENQLREEATGGWLLLDGCDRQARLG